MSLGININDLGAWASILSLFLGILGFGITLWQLFVIRRKILTKFYIHILRNHLLKASTLSTILKKDFENEQWDNAIQRGEELNGELNSMLGLLKNSVHSRDFGNERKGVLVICKVELDTVRQVLKSVENYTQPRHKARSKLENICSSIQQLAAQVRLERQNEELLP